MRTLDEEKHHPEEEISRIEKQITTRIRIRPSFLGSREKSGYESVEVHIRIGKQTCYIDEMTRRV